MDANLYNKINEYIADLTVATRNISIFHWNLISDNFILLHEYFGEIYEKMSNFIDLSAEQIRSKGPFPVANLEDSIKMAKIKSVPSDKSYNLNQSVKMSVQMIEYLNKSLDDIIKIASDMSMWDTADVFTGQMVDLGKMLYFLNSSLKNKEA